MGDSERQSAAFHALEALLEPEPRTLPQVLAAAQPLSGDELHEVAEERALAGACGSPMCTNPLPQVAGGARRKLSHTTFCSGACEKAVGQLAAALSTEEAARQRFVRMQRGGPPTTSGSRSGFNFGRAVGGTKRQQPDEEAGARGGGVTTMSATVQERVPEAANPAALLQAQLDVEEPMLMDTVAEREPAAPTAAGPAEAEAQPAAAPEVVQRPRRASLGSRPRVTFADDVQGGADEEPLATGPPAGPTAGSAAAQLLGQLGPHDPVLVLDVEDAAPGAELRQQFGRLQVREAGAVGMGRPDPILGRDGHSAEQAEQSAVGAVAERQPALGDVLERQPAGSAAAEQGGALIGEVMERQPAGNAAEHSAPVLGEVMERQSAGHAAAEQEAPVLGEVTERHVNAASPAPPAGGGAGHPGRRRLTLRQRTREQVAAGDFPTTLNDGKRDYLDDELEAEERAVEAAMEGREVSDAESDGSEQSYFEDLRAMDMEGSDGEDEAAMPQPFPVLSKFGQLFTALDSWVTCATLDYIRGEAAQRQPMDATGAQRRDVFLRSVAACLPGLLRALHISMPRAALEQPMQDMAATLDFTEPIGSIQVQHWEVALMTFLKALSFTCIPDLQAPLESCEGIVRVSKELAARGITEEHFACLVEVLVPID